MITVDIVSPVGGKNGGIENVIIDWTKHLDSSIFTLRIFHLHSGMAYLNGYPRAYCLDKPFEKADLQHCIDGYKLFINECGAPDICIATNWPMMSKACEIVRKELQLSYTILSWVHNTVEIYDRTGLGGFSDMLHADAHLAINGDIARQLLELDPNANVYLVGNPVCLQDSSAYTPDPLTLAYVGRFGYEKRIDIILEAIYKASAPWKLKLIGDGELATEVKSWIQLLKLQNQVELHGWSDTPWAECMDASALLLASEYEGFCLTAWEASSIGMTVISTPVSGVTDYIVPGENGYLYPQEDADALAHLLNEISSHKLAFCNPQACRSSVSHQSTDAYFAKINKILSEIVNAN